MPRCGRWRGWRRRRQNEVLVTSDADARVSRDYLRRCVQVLADGTVALASCLYVGRSTGGFWAQLDAVGKSVEMSGGILVADMLEGTKFALGVTMILRKEAFVGGGRVRGAGAVVCGGLCAGEPAGGEGAGGADVEPCDSADGAAAGVLAGRSRTSCGG